MKPPLLTCGLLYSLKKAKLKTGNKICERKI